MLERKGIFSIEEVKTTLGDLVFQKKCKAQVDFFGTRIKANSQRYQLFLSKGCTCVNCGIEGKYFARERTKEQKESYHLNLYALDENSEEVLMTKDHIIPKSKGGKNYLGNYQVMCVKCNVEKGNSYE